MTATSPSITLEMIDVERILIEVTSAVRRLDGFTTGLDQQDGKGRKSNHVAAEVSRDLLRTSELLRLAAAELTTQYWTLKGYSDPRFPGSAASAIEAAS